MLPHAYGPMHAQLPLADALSRRNVDQQMERFVLPQITS